MEFAGVKFENGDIAVVNKKWFTPRKKEIFWPPCKTQREFDKLIKENAEPLEESWKIYSVKRSFFECSECIMYNIISLEHTLIRFVGTYVYIEHYFVADYQKAQKK